MKKKCILLIVLTCSLFLLSSCYRQEIGEINGQINETAVRPSTQSDLIKLFGIPFGESYSVYGNANKEAMKRVDMQTELVVSQ